MKDKRSKCSRCGVLTKKIYHVKHGEWEPLKFVRGPHKYISMFCKKCRDIRITVHELKGGNNG